MESTPNTSEPSSSQGPVSTNVMPNVMFREIHKNAWLKRHSSDRRAGFPRKSEKVWVVFCVHDDVEAFLESYADQKVALTHKPDWFTSLNQTLHVSPSICGQEDEFEFAVTLSSQVVRLAAPNWDLMMEWVDTIRNKLRELKVLSPRENLYSKLPEHRLPLLPTRDPNSPLPLPPQGPSTIVPGVEPVRLESGTAAVSVEARSQVHPSSSREPNVISRAPATALGRSESLRTGQEAQSSSNFRSRRLTPTDQNVRSERASETHSSTEYLRPVQRAAGTSQDAHARSVLYPVEVNKPRVRLSRAVSVPEATVPQSSLLVNTPLSESNVTVIEVSNHRGSHSASDCGEFKFPITDRETFNEDVFLTPPVTPRPEAREMFSELSNNVSNMSINDSHYEHVCLASSPHPAPSISHVTFLSNSPNSSINSINSKLNEKEKSSLGENAGESSLASGNTNLFGTSVLTVNQGTASQVSIIPIASSSLTVSEENHSNDSGEESDVKLKVQTKLEKINSSGMIPRVTSKNSKSESFKKLSKAGSDFPGQFDVPSENRVKAGPSNAAKSSVVSNVIVNGKVNAIHVNRNDNEVPSTSNNCDAAVPEYSQINKLNKTKNIVKHNASSSGQSPTPAKRKINEAKEVLVKTALDKPEVLPRTTSNRQNIEINQPQPNMVETNMVAKSDIHIDGVEQELGNTEPGSSKMNHTTNGSSGCSVSENTNISPVMKNVHVNHKSQPILTTNYSLPLDNISKNSSPLGAVRKPEPSPHASNKNQKPAIPPKISINNKNDNEPNTKRGEQNSVEQNTPVQPVVSAIKVKDIPMIGGHQRRRRRSSSSDAGAQSSAQPTRGIAGADRIRLKPDLNVALPIRTEPKVILSGRSESRNQSAGSVVPLNHQASELIPSGRLTLREQQVLQLRKEMLHPGGVRLLLRKKDCTQSIALVDVLGGVWVAGWKQKDHPMLYNALHIGDQLMSVATVLVHNAADAHKLMLGCSNHFIEIIIRRLPFGRVFALERSSEGQSVGIVQEGNTAEIKEILPNSIAALAGLSSKTPSSDGLSITTWFLTEINGRPLNLFFKDGEVRDRLNAVGKEISVLVQPHDFIKQLKKYLKSIRGYKDYIVQ